MVKLHTVSGISHVFSLAIKRSATVVIDNLNIVRVKHLATLVKLLLTEFVLNFVVKFNIQFLRDISENTFNCARIFVLGLVRYHHVCFIIFKVVKELMFV